MPELPEVESVRKQLDPELSGRIVTDVWWDPHPSIPRQFHDVPLLLQRKIERVGRRGKFLICPLDEDLELVMHLGMTGSFSFGPSDAYARAKLTLDDERVLVFRDPRRFGRLAVVEAGDYTPIPTLHALGPEPLSDEFDPKEFARRLRKSGAPIKTALMSQKIVAGVGNIYADEALWLAKISPTARGIGPRRAAVLHDAIRKVLAGAIEREGTTFRDYVMVNGESGRNVAFLAAYGRAGQPCPRCATLMRKKVLGGRTTTYCPRCQRS
jgi:formamidopyrimidine-DNA glycosylase